MISVFRFFDNKDHSRGVMLPGLMIFVNDHVIEFNKHQADNLLPGEFDLTEFVADLGKFKLEANWCARDNVNNSTYGWGIFIAYKKFFKNVVIVKFLYFWKFLYQFLKHFAFIQLP